MATSVHADDPARLAVFDELRQLALQTYGEERAAEKRLQAALKAAANAIWRVSQEPIQPTGDEP